MQDKIFSLLGIAAKAGKTVSGGFSVEEAVKSRKARVVIVAEDAQQNTVKKFTDKCRHNNVALRFYGSKEELGHAVGKESRACVAVTDRGFAQSLLKKMDVGKGFENAKSPVDRAAIPAEGSASGGPVHDESLQRGSPAEPSGIERGTCLMPDEPLDRLGP